MKIFSTTLFIGLLTIFTSTAYAGSDGSEDRVTPQPKPRLATCSDCRDAGYRRGYADAEAAILSSSSVTTPPSYRKPVYVQAPAARQPVQRIQQSAHHSGHGHHTQAQVIDCELTDSLNRAASPVTTIISTQRYSQPVKASKPRHRVVRKAPVMKRVANIKHDSHYHHTASEKADCALTDALNRGAGPVSRVISTHRNRHQSPVKHHARKTFSHGNHGHHSEVERADCALTDALNRGGSVVHIVRKH